MVSIKKYLRFEQGNYSQIGLGRPEVYCYKKLQELYEAQFKVDT